jgi:hypothetical protein
VGFGFDFLGEEFAEDDLFCEVFGSDDRVVGTRRGTGSEAEKHGGDEGAKPGREAEIRDGRIIEPCHS